MKALVFSVLTFALASQAALTRGEVHDLVVKGEQGASTCNKIFDQVRSLDKNFDYGRTFPNRKAAIQAIKILEKFPGTPAPTKELMDRLITSKAKGLDMAWLSKEMDRTLVCDPMSLNLTLTKLVRSSRSFTFTKKQKQWMAKVMLTQLRKEAEFPTHLGLLAPYVLILDALVEQRAIKLSESAALKREELRQELQTGLSRLKDKDDELKKKVNDKEFQTKNFIVEVRENEAFRVKFLEFMDTVTL